MHEVVIDRELLDPLTFFCVFIGYPYSGHSLVGSIIDAHPNAVISHELHIGKLIKKGLPREKIFAMILLNSIKFARGGRVWNDYHYAIPGEWNGRYTDIKVIGDKKGSGSTKFFTKKAEIFEKVNTCFCVPVKYIHVMRNPFDMMSTLFLKTHYSGSGKMQHVIDRTLSHLEMAEKLRMKVDHENWLDLYHEQLIDSPAMVLEALFNFFNLPVPAGFVDNCRKILFPIPHKSRLKIAWTQEEIDYVSTQIAGLERFSSYSFNQ